MVGEIKELAANYREEGKRYFLQIEECSLTTSEVRTVCEALKKKISKGQYRRLRFRLAVPLVTAPFLAAVIRLRCRGYGPGRLQINMSASCACLFAIGALITNRPSSRMGAPGDHFATAKTISC